MKSKCCVNNKVLAKVGKTADLLKVIADENRLKILCILKKGELCVCDIWANLGLSQNLVSHHLKILKEAGLIASRKEGLWNFYGINKKAVDTLILILNNLLHDERR